MNEKRNSRPADGTAEAGQGENAAFGMAAFSDIDYITFTPDRQRLAPLLGHGKSAAVPGRELAGMLGLDDLRELTKLVERERAAGVPICATTDARGPGYYLASGPGELDTYIKSLDSRLHNVRRTRDRMADTLEKMTGQGRLW